MYVGYMGDCLEADDTDTTYSLFTTGLTKYTSRDLTA